MDDAQDKCKKVLRWSQYGPICWFMAILSVMFHSQRSRNLLLNLSENWPRKIPQMKEFDDEDFYNPAGKNSKTKELAINSYIDKKNKLINRLNTIYILLQNDKYNEQLLNESNDIKINLLKLNENIERLKNYEEKTTKYIYNDEFKNRYYDIKSKDELFYLIRHILKYKYIHSDNEEDDHKFFRLFSGEIILQYLFNIEPSYLTKDANRNGFVSEIILNKFYEILDVSCLMLQIFSESKNVYYNIYNHYSLKDTLKNGVYKTIKNEEEINSILNLKRNPDVLIIQLTDTSDKVGKYAYKEYELQEHYNITQKIGQDNSDNILSLNDTIIYNNNTYILDSVILENYNKSRYGHAISGITCNNERYVYNGWTSDTNDPGIQNKENIKKLNACEIIKHNWDVKNENNFCLNPQNCSLSNLETNSEEKDVCFSFSKGKRIIVYIKKDTSDNPNYNDIFKIQSFKPFSYSVNSIKNSSIDNDIKLKSNKNSSTSISSKCSSSSFLIQKRITDCFDRKKFINKMLNIKDTCLNLTTEPTRFDSNRRYINTNKYTFSFDEYNIKLVDMIFLYYHVNTLVNYDNNVMKYIFTKDSGFKNFSIVYNAIINEHFEITVIIQSINNSKYGKYIENILGISNKLLQQTSKIVQQQKNPHFLYVYKSLSCNNKDYEYIHDTDDIYEDYSTDNFNVLITEKINGKLSDLIKNIKNDNDIKINILTQIILCIHSIHSYTSYCLVNFFNINIFETMAYMNVENNIYIKYLWNDNIYYLKSFGYLILFYNYSYLNTVEFANTEGYNLKKITTNLDIYNDYYFCLYNYKLIDIANKISQYKHSGTDDFYLQYFIENKIINLITSLPDDARILNEKPYILGRNNSSQNSDWANDEYNKLFKTPSIKSSQLSSSNNQLQPNIQPSLHSIIKINSKPPNKPIPLISIQYDIEDIINKIENIINSYNELNENIKNIHVKRYTFTKIKSFIKQDNSTQKKLNEFIEKCDIILNTNDNIIKEIDKLVEQLNIKCKLESKGGDYSSEKYRININQHIENIIKDKEDLLKNIKDCNSINYLLKPFITNLKYYTNQIKTEYNNIKNKYYKPLK